MTSISFIAHEAAVTRLERINKRLITATVIQSVITFLEAVFIFTAFTSSKKIKRK